MADSKITALTAITTVNPATYPLVIVDTSDTSMAITGTTKKVTTNQLLGSGGTATLASATISGALEAARLNVTGATIPANGVYLGSANNLSFSAASTLAMTLNSTGLGVGVTPAAGDGSGAFKAAGTGSLTANSRVGLDVRELVSGNQAGIILGAMTTENTAVIGSRTGSGNIAFQTYNGASWGERMRIDYLGNVGIGVTPSAWAGIVGIQSAYGALSGNTNINILRNSYYNGGWKYTANGRATQYQQDIASHIWYYDTGTQVAGAACNFTAAMTLDASGRLLVAKTTSATGSTGCELQTGAGGNSASVFTADGAFASIMNRLTSDGIIVDLRRQTLSVGNISVTTTGATFNSTSDYRLKEAVQPLVGGLARVSALKPSIYKWKADGSSGEGFLAHELAEVVPAAVSGEKDAVNEDGSIKPQGVDMSRVVPILVAAIQELTARVQTLETR